MLKSSQLVLLPGLLTAFIVTAAAACADIDKPGLRALARPPKISGTINFGYNSIDGYRMITDSVLTKETPESIRKTLRGDDEDARRYQRLGDALYQSNPDEGRKAWQQSLDLYRKKFQRVPNDGESLAAVVRLLDALGRTNERDAAMATALKLAPRNAQVWQTRIWLETEMAMATAFGPSLARTWEAVGFPSVAAALVGSSPPRPSAAKIHEARRLLQQAKDDYDKAIVLLPNSDYIYASRAVFGPTFRLEFGLLDLAAQQSPLTMDMLTTLQNDSARAWLEPVSVNDMVTAGRVSRNEPFAVGMGAYIAMGAELSRKRPQEVSSNKGTTLQILTSETRQIVQEALARLDTMSRSSNKQLAGRSFLAMGVLKLMALTPAEATSALIQAHGYLSDDPRPVDALVLAYSKERHWADMNAMLTTALKTKENDSWRMALIKTDEYQSHWKEAEQNTRILLQHDPQNTDGNLALAALLLRAANDDVHLQAAAEQLKKAGDQTRPPLTADQSFCLYYLESIYLALAGNLTEARTILEQLQQHADEEQAADIKAVVALLPAR